MALSSIMLGIDSFNLSNNLKITEAHQFYNFSISDTIPVKSEDPMQPLFDAVDKMDRKLQGMGKQQSKDSLNTSGDSTQTFFIEMERTIKHEEEDLQVVE